MIIEYQANNELANFLAPEQFQLYKDIMASAVTRVSNGLFDIADAG